MTTRILIGDCRDVLKTLPDESVHCCITSPPYWNLRSYLPQDHPNKAQEIGSEPTLQEWVATLVDVFHEVRRVLRKDGTLWLNLGDSYSGSRRGGYTTPSATLNGRQNAHSMTASRRRDNHPVPRSDVAVPGLKAKNLMGQPWRLAFALQDDGWWLRDEIIWNKLNPMPESAGDRCTRSHEHIFMLTKSARYYYDSKAIQEPVTGGAHARTEEAMGLKRPGFGRGYDAQEKPRYRTPSGWDTRPGSHRDLAGRYEPPVTPKAQLATSGDDGAYADGKGERLGRGAGWRVKNNASMDAALTARPSVRNKRSVWTFPTAGFRGAHFATFPPALARPCILAGCRVGGTVLDPFGGSGTTGLVADQEGRNAILIDLDERNEAMAAERVRADAGLFADVTGSGDD